MLRIQTLALGLELVQSRVHPEGANLVTSFEFYTNDQQTLTYGKPHVIRYPDNNWEVRQYETDLGSVWVCPAPLQRRP